MHRRIRIVVALVALAAAVIVPRAQAQVQQDSVSGQATNCDLLFESTCFRFTSVDLDARSGPNGESPTGRAGWTWLFGSTQPLHFEGAVTCLAVTGNVAIIGFTTGPSRTLIRATDGGTAPGQDTFSVVTHGSTSGQPTVDPDCSSFPPPSMSGEDVHIARGGKNDFGDIIVTDGQPVPTSPGQCKNGGWRNYGTTFQNQGQCAAFVQRGAKPAP